MEEIGAYLHLKIRYCQILHQRLVDRSLRLKKGRGRAQHCSQVYEIPIEDSDTAVNSVALQQKVIELTNRVASLEKDKNQADCPTGMSLFHSIVHVWCMQTD